MRLLIISTLFVTAELGLGVLVGSLLRRSSAVRPLPPARPEPCPQLPPVPLSRSALIS